MAFRADRFFDFEESFSDLLSCFRGMLFEKFHDQCRRGGIEFMAAGVNKSHQRGAAGRRINCALIVPPLAAGDATVDPAHHFHRECLPRDIHERIVMPADDHRGLGRQLSSISSRRCRRSDRRKNIPARKPEQISKTAAIGMAGAINPFRVYLIILIEPREHGVEEFKIAISLVAGGGLPAGQFSLRIGKLTGSVQPLHINRNGLRPLFVHGESVRRIIRGTAVTVKDENHRREVGFGISGRINQRCAYHAIDRD